jgi:hypothetical protein
LAAWTGASPTHAATAAAAITISPLLAIFTLRSPFGRLSAAPTFGRLRAAPF